MPKDEFICDGGDHGTPAGFSGDGGLRGSARVGARLRRRHAEPPPAGELEGGAAELAITGHNGQRSVNGITIQVLSAANASTASRRLVASGNRPAIEMLMRYAAEQGLIPRAYRVEELFVT